MSTYYTILGVSPGATQEEITKAYKRLALKYHPDRNRGNEEWAKQKFIEVGEAYQSLMNSSSATSGMPRKKFQFSNKPGSNKFKEFEEMLKEVTRNLDNIEKNLDEAQESLNREQERLWSEAIRNMEENLNLAGVSVSDLDSSLWSPYSDWKEKVRNSFASSLDVFLSNMRIAINNAEWEKKKNNSGFGQGGQNHNQHKGPADNENKDYRDKGSNYETPPNSDKITQLKKDIEILKKYLSDPQLTEGQKAETQEKLSRFEKELALLENQSNSKPNQLPSPKDNTNKDNNDNSNDKDKKIKDLETEISQLKNNNKNETPQQQEETNKKIVEKEQEWKTSINSLTIEQLTAKIQTLQNKIAQLETTSNSESDTEKNFLTEQLKALQEAKNRKLSSSTPNSTSSKLPTGLIIGGIGGTITLIIIGALVIRNRRGKKSRKR